ncbi:MAG: hypothetical protein DRH03_01400, partial [Deltaproteobacteria bacterium]
MFALRIYEIMNRLIKVVVVLVILLSGAALIAASYYFAPVIAANQRGVVMTGDADKGDNLTVLAPGKHYWFISGYNPITNTLARVEISEQELDLAGGDEAGVELTTKDGDTVFAEFSAWYRIIPAQAGQYMAASGDTDITKMVSSITVATSQSEGALYDAEIFYQGDKRFEYVAAVKEKVNQQLAARGVELTILECSKFHFSKGLLQKIDEIKQTRAMIEVNKVKVQAAAVAAQETEELAKGRRKAALQEAEARKESVIMASEAQIVAARNWVTAEKIKAEVLLVRSKAKAEAMQIEAAANVFSGAEGERFLRYRIADSLADAWAQRNSINPVGDNLGLDGIASGISELSVPLQTGS